MARKRMAEEMRYKRMERGMEGSGGKEKPKETLQKRNEMNGGGETKRKKWLGKYRRGENANKRQVIRGYGKGEKE